MTQDGFYQSLSPSRDFAGLTRAGAFTPLPRDWMVGCCDIVNSTDLIASGRYKTVNTIGASVIAAMINALQGVPFPYVFGGDGASFAVGPEYADIARDTLARLRSWASAEFDIDLRAALLPVSWIRAEGLDVAVARYAVSEAADYAMFAGGGLNWAERQMKLGGFEVPPAPLPDPPDLTGLSCRWNTIPARNGLILSVVVQPEPTASAKDFAKIAVDILAVADKLQRNGHPVPEGGPSFSFPPPGLTLEAKISRGKTALILRKAQLFIQTTLAAYALSRKRPLGSFDAQHYRRMLVANADFRKFDDGLKLTLDCPPQVRDDITRILEKAATAGHARYGLHEQDEALVTCIVPSVMRDDHVHFIDGASGGYTQAALRMAASDRATA
ncbi:DUF3095 domain-containing protein [Phaeobacter inhibens]|uniref:DUF3095 domain-containing protein n=1 Tax=Phaeobacter inhibens TaxID=221822 RepID=UPI0021A27D76|nr:DUF3095 domain-containing protein [Phaeobacter inhibens]UWR53156.1 DUF3095 domain-containing protein [Phaeobacter inhibens]